MRLRCRKCGGTFDPETQSAFCVLFEHAPVKSTEQKLPAALQEIKEKKKRPSEFQSDFRLIWEE
jgi:hypothetical protein